MSHWDHRVVRKTYPDGTVMLSIHEAFCDTEGRVWAITQDPISPRVDATNNEETVEDLKKVIGWMLMACVKPILDADSIPEEGAQAPSWTESLEDLEDLDLLDEEFDKTFE